MKNIQKNKMGKYRYYFNYEGKRYQGSWCNSLALAREQLFEAQAKVCKDGFIDNKQITFRQVHDWFMERHTGQIEGSTHKKELDDLKNHVLPKFGDYPIASITVDYCQSVYDEWASDLVGHKKLRGYVSRVFKEAMRRDIISRNPFDLVQQPLRYKKPSPKDFLEKDELIEFNSVAHETLPLKKYLMVRVLEKTGARRGEVVGLRWSSIDFKHNTITINKSVKTGVGNKLYLGKTKNDSSCRTVEVDTETIELLAKWKKQQALRIRTSNLRVKRDSEQMIFENAYNSLMYPQKVYNVVKEVLNKTTITKDIGPHSFRHTWSTLAINGGMDISKVSAQLGHASSRTTLDNYTHLTEESRSKTMKEFEAITGNW